MITSIQYTNFKALENFTLHLKDFNVLTGPNNNGKSTILDGIRVLQGAYRYASRNNPRFIMSPYGGQSYGYEIPKESIPIILENIQTNFNTDDPSIIKYKFSGGQFLSIFFHVDHPIYLFFDTPRKYPLKASEFRDEFPVNISIIPTLGPFEIDEELLNQDYVKRWYGSRRSPRMFRSYWFYNPDGFSEFKNLVVSTWKGMSITAPERKGTFSKELMMFCEEDRMPREISWAGFGFQIWLQLLTHIVNSKNCDLLVVDEPEIYLHPDLQHKILDILKYTKSRIVIATHSVEIINAVEPSEVLLIDKKNKTAKRISDLDGLQSVSNILGSGQNIHLTRLARGKKILFVEGNDLKLLSRLAKICKLDDLFSGGEITVIPIDGFSKHDKVIHTNWAFTQIIGEKIKIAVLLDRDYHSQEEVDSILEKLGKESELAHILKRKEIENYYLIPTGISKALENRLLDKISNGVITTMPKFDITAILFELSDNYKMDILAQLQAHQLKLHSKSGKDTSTIISKAAREFEINWKKLDFRLTVISGKSMLTLLNDHFQNNYNAAITLTQIANNISAKDLDSDIVEFLKKLDNFRQN